MTDHFRLSPTELRLALRDQGYDPVPVSGVDMNVKSAGKRPVMPNWQNRCFEPTLEEIRSWEARYPDSCNTGLLCGRLIGVDIDILNRPLAAIVEEHIVDRLGPTPLVRTGRDPKALLCYRLAVPIDKIQTAAIHFTDDPLEKPTKVEVLARGQHFVGFGTHPETMQPYRWFDATPLTVAFKDLPETTYEKLLQVVAEAEEILRKNGGATPRERKQENKKREDKGRRAAGFRSHEKPDRATIEEALAHVPNDFDYDGWIRIGFALYDGLGEAGRDLWERWSATSPKDDADFTSGKWSSFAGGRSVTIATLFYHATQNGWRRQGRSGAPRQDRAERRASADPEAEPQEDDGRPIVRFVYGKVPEAVDRMESLLLEARVEIYARAGALVRPVLDTVPAAKGRMTTVARMCPFTTVSLADRAARILRVQKFDRRADDWLDINPPHEMTATLLAREGLWNCPQVAGIITTPTLRPDGSLLTAAGYDPATRLYLAHDPDFVMPALTERPTKEEAHAALQFIDRLLDGFPFVGPIDRAVALSGIFTAIVRGVLPTAPLHAIRAHTPGTGKSFLVDLASTIASGRRCPVIAAGKTEEETEKRLGALLRDAVPVVSIDNVNGELGGDMLCQLTERPLVRVRILGKSEAPELECRSTVFATGNNLVLLGDMTRRALVCSLDAEVDRPELRTFGFDPVARVLADRASYVAAALTVIRAYRVAGSPAVCGPLGSYEDWSEMVRAPLIWLGQADPAESMETAREEDPELSAIRELIGYWRDHLTLSEGYTTNAITKIACAKVPTSSFDFSQQGFLLPEFRDLLLRQAGEGGVVNSRRLGRWLSRIKGRVVDGYRIEMKVDSSNGNRFSLCQIGSLASGWSAPEF
ncbi:Bifunctional DNA primase/polymerase, N-terminal [Methylobacterium sp. UNC378MF]|uniref:PriCT-2 domain-containing protein n=1 Tax=Methylobacterium sp. UNC378MF TaxID=1502748 RepID=UPI00088DAD3C|nr:PriCT-2 domain-containing protein [Methylobacterium sp. UNC378MF]SDA18413.1 Bifunctional DNA primase/polymerase, N-terminal [Methylobacterium sp. UNC378MF]